MCCMIGERVVGSATTVHMVQECPHLTYQRKVFSKKRVANKFGNAIMWSPIL